MATQAEQTREVAKPLDTAPKDHTMLWLLVDYSGDGANPLEDEILGWTPGFNGFDHTGVDEWQFAGWNWEQDCFTDGFGKVVGWCPLLRPDQQPAAPADEPTTVVKDAWAETAAHMLKAWSQWFDGKDGDKVAADRVFRAATFGCEAFETALCGIAADGAPIAMLRSFLTALIDPLHPDLDYLRIDPASGAKARSERDAVAPISSGKVL